MESLSWCKITTLLIAIISIYQRFVSPLLGSHCRFHPSCSHYAIKSLKRFGICRGGWLAGKRLIKCHPFSLRGNDTFSPKHK